MRKMTYLKNTFKTLSDYDKITRKRIIESIEKIPQGDIKKLQGEKYPPVYRLRVGKYRIMKPHKKSVVLLGSGGHAKLIIQTIKKYNPHFDIFGILEKDESKVGKMLFDVPIVGTDRILYDLYKDGLKKAFISVGTVGDYKIRNDLYNFVKDIGFEFINVFHKKSVICESAIFGIGNAFMASCIIGTDARIGNNCILNTACIIEHDCIIGNNVHIAPGAIVCGGVQIGDNCMIGAGATIIQEIKIGNNSIVGAGSVVIRDIPANCVTVGNPAKVIKERD